VSLNRLPHTPPDNHPQASPRPLKFAALLRVSSSGQTRADRYGYDEQQDDILAKARELGYSDDGAIWFKFWESATDASTRPKFLERVEDIVELREAGIIDTIIFGRPDRLSRDGEGWFFTYLTTLEGHGKAQVRFGRDDVEPQNPHRHKRAQRGMLPTGSRPDRPLFGYRYLKAEGRREFDPETRPLLEKLISRVLGGMPVYQATKLLYQENAIYLDDSGVRQLLKNPALAGRTVSRWKREDGTVEEIPLPNVTPAVITWEEHQALLRRLNQDATEARYHGKQRVHFYPLSGHQSLSCAGCGSPLVGAYSSGRSGRHYREYRHKVTRRSARGLANPCANPEHRWKAWELEARVWWQVLTYFSNPEEAIDRLEGQVGSPLVRDQIDADLAGLERALTEIQGEMERLDHIYRRGRRSPEEYDRELDPLQAEENRLSQQIESRKAQRDALRRVDRDRLLELARDVVAWPPHFDPWQMEPGSESDDDLLENMTFIRTGTDGAEYQCVDPDHGVGHRVWEYRVKLMRDLGVRVSVMGRDVRVCVAVPVSTGDSALKRTRKPAGSTFCPRINLPPCARAWASATTLWSSPTIITRASTPPVCGGR
jgi:hypothetical protein